MKRVVIDTNVLLSGLRSRQGASFAVIELVAERTIRPLVTTALFLEYEAVVKRIEHRRATGLSVEVVDQVLRELAALSEGVHVYFMWRPQLPDPHDEMVLEAAVNGRAEALITHNVKDFHPASNLFGLRVLTPAAFFKEILR